MARIRRERLRYLYRLPHTRQIALVQATRSARLDKLPRPRPVELPLADQMINLMPNLRIFALPLTHNATRADDLVQETFMRAWASRANFQPDANVAACLFTILRNRFSTEHRKHRLEIEDPGEGYAYRMIVLPEQDAVLDLKDLRRVLGCLLREQREAILLVGADGLS